MSRAIPVSAAADAPALLRRRRGRAAALMLTGALGAAALAGCGSADGARDDGSSGAPRLKVSGAFIPEPVTRGMAAGFLTVDNTGGADTLTSVTSGLAARVTLHSTQGSAMRHRDSFPVPAHGALSFTHGHNHLMLERLTRLPKVGETVPVELHFRRSGTVAVRVPVRPATYDPGHASRSARSQRHSLVRS